MSEQIHAKKFVRRKRATPEYTSSEESDVVPAPARKKAKLTRKSATHAASLHRIQNASDIREGLLKWYAKVHTTRGMPWRKEYDPSFNREQRAQRAYEVWISEIMLQQTQVATVIPYYNRWMERFPTIRELAAADIETVNGLWKGLGYYSRAARLLSGAQKCVQDYDGRLPDNAKEMEAKIPGIGRYSAGAICSIAYNEAAPVLDGNVNRLMSRVLALHAPPKSKATLDVLWDGAIAMVKGSDRPGDVNQAMIELGSTVCKPKAPDCMVCPIKSHCGAYNLSKTQAVVKDIEELCTLCEPIPAPATVSSFPMKVERTKAREEVDCVNVIEWRNNDDEERHFLLIKRPETGLLAGLYDFPSSANLKATVAEDEAALRKIPGQLLTSLLKEKALPLKGGEDNNALRITKVASIGDVPHIFSHIKKTYRVQWVVLKSPSSAPPIPIQADTRWLPLDSVAKANIGTGVMKIWKLMEKHWKRR